MFTSLSTNTLNKVRVVEELVVIHEKIIGEKDAVMRRGMKLYAVSSCVTHLYAIFENFIETGISDFLDAIPELVTYKSLSKGLKNEYRIGISHVLSRIDSKRYNHLVHENVILWYHEALSNAGSYRFVTEALTRHDQNLRLSVIDGMLSRIQLKDLRGWLSRHPDICFLYTEEALIYEQLEAELRSFVQLRNDAAHGVLDDLEGRDNLRRFCLLITCLVTAISSFLRKDLLLKRSDAGKAKIIGSVTEVFVRNGAFIAVVANGTALSKGDVIYLVGSNYCDSQEIQSMQINDNDVDHVIADHEDFEIGIKCALAAKRNAALYILSTPESPSPRV